MRAIESAENLYAAVSPYLKNLYDGINTNPLHPSQARMVVGLSFLRIMAAWESYLEDVFLRYVCGAKTNSGYSPNRKIVGCKKIEDAYHIIAGDPDFSIEKGYLVWSDYKKVIGRARIYFQDGKPFTDLNDVEKQMLKEGNIIRNRIAHSSDKCINDFVLLAKQKENIKKLPKGYSVGRFLIENRKGVPTLFIGDNRFECYLNMFENVATKIVK
jgi:hypothetical protein